MKDGMTFMDVPHVRVMEAIMLPDTAVEMIFSADDEELEADVLLRGRIIVSTSSRCVASAGGLISSFRPHDVTHFKHDGFLQSALRIC